MKTNTISFKQLKTLIKETSETAETDYLEYIQKYTTNYEDISVFDDPDSGSIEISDVSTNRNSVTIYNKNSKDIKLSWRSSSSSDKGIASIEAAKKMIKMLEVAVKEAETHIK